MAERPRILLIPTLTELEWAVRPLLEEWADVASYDAPLLEEPTELPVRANAERALDELDRLGWERAVIVGDEIGSLSAVLTAGARPEATRALVLGHPLVSLDMSGREPTLNRAVVEAHVQLAGTSFRAFVREQFRAWMGLYGRPAADADDLAERYVARVPHEVATGFHRHLLDRTPDYERLLRETLSRLPAIPTLLVCHEGCLMYTQEGFDQAAAAFPHAETAATHQKPSVDPAFAAQLREFVERHAG